MKYYVLTRIKIWCRHLFTSLQVTNDDLFYSSLYLEVRFDRIKQQVRFNRIKQHLMELDGLYRITL